MGLIGHHGNRHHPPVAVNVFHVMLKFNKSNLFFVMEDEIASTECTNCKTAHSVMLTSSDGSDNVKRHIGKKHKEH
jgi:hypothetical protein